MSEQYIHIRNWDRFQHYKKRNPPWLKDYTEQLSDEAYLSLSGHRRAILHGLRLEYARSRCRLPLDTLSLTRRLNLRVTMKDIEALNHAGFVEVLASSVLAERKQDAMPETETETEKVLFAAPEKKPKATGSVSPIRKPREADPLWDAMVAAFDAGEFTDSSRGVMNRAVGELRKVGATPQQVGDRKRAYEKKFPDIACTPPALVKHWPYLNGARPAPTTAAERYRQEHERREAH